MVAWGGLRTHTLSLGIIKQTNIHKNYTRTKKVNESNTTSLSLHYFKKEIKKKITKIIRKASPDVKKSKQNACNIFV